MTPQQTVSPKANFSPPLHNLASPFPQQTGEIRPAKLHNCQRDSAEHPYLGIASPLFVVLLVTADKALGETRGLVLRTGGCSVITATREQVRQFSPRGSFRVAVICQSVQAAYAQELARELRASSPGIRIIRISMGSDGTESGFDHVLNAPVDPALLKHSIIEKR